MFENVAAVEMALVAEVVVDRGVDGSEFLQGLEVSEPRHRRTVSWQTSIPRSNSRSSTCLSDNG